MSNSVGFVQTTIWKIPEFEINLRLKKFYKHRPWSALSEVLFISYKFVKGFLAITFLLLVYSNWNFHDVCQRFLYNQKRNFSLIRLKWEISPQTPIIKSAHFCNVMSIDMTLQKWAIFIMGVYGEMSHF